MTTDDQTIKDVVWYLRNKGITLYFQNPGIGWFSFFSDVLCKDDLKDRDCSSVVNYCNDKMQFFADIYQVSRLHVVRYFWWYDYHDCQCLGISKKGKPCGDRYYHKGGPIGINDFIPGESELCPDHKGQILRIDKLFNDYIKNL
jgi:hypothetical protein